MRKALPHSARLVYQGFILAPGIGYLAHRRGRFVRLALRAGGTDRSSGTSKRCPHSPTTWLNRSVPGPRCRCTGSSTCASWFLFGTDDTAIHTDLLAGYEDHTDDMEIEFVPGCGHFIADERPDLVSERARAFFTSLTPESAFVRLQHVQMQIRGRAAAQPAWA